MVTEEAAEVLKPCPAGGPGLQTSSIFFGVVAPIACFGTAFSIGMFERYGGAVYPYASAAVLGMTTWLWRGGRNARLDAVLAGILGVGALVATGFAVLLSPFASMSSGAPSPVRLIAHLMGLLALVPIPAAVVYLIQASRALRSARSHEGPVRKASLLAGILAPLLVAAGLQSGLSRIDHCCARAMISEGTQALERIRKWRPLASLLPLTEMLEEYARETETFTRLTPRSQNLVRAYHEFKGIDHLSFESQRHAGRLGKLYWKW